MGWNDVYWKHSNNRTVYAKKHHELMLEKYPDEIQESICDTIEYDSRNKMFDLEKTSTDDNTFRVSVVNMDTVSAIMKYGVEEDTIALNFASYKHAGGGYMQGSSAQEESLCMESILYEVLSNEQLADYYAYNNQHLNHALYENRALLSPHIIFEKDGQKKKVSVLTVASPNRRAYMTYTANASENKNLEVLENRIRFITEIISNNRPDTVILGAFGCGVFGQDPYKVSEMFKKWMKGVPVKNVIYAVIDKGGHSKEGAYAIFKKTFET